METRPGSYIKSRRLSTSLLVICSTALLLSCAPASSPTAGPGGTDAAREFARPASRGPQTLRIGVRQEPTAGVVLFAGLGVGGVDPMLTYHAGLTKFDDQGVLMPHLARKIPSLADGDWKASPDGSMEVTWTLRPNVRWHDGTPLSAADVVLGWRVATDDEIPANRGRWASLVVEATAPDDETLVMTWRQPYMLANAFGVYDIPPLPRHIVGPLYQRGDKQALINSPYWTRDFVGLGPYRIAEWRPASVIVAQAFDDYFLGRPKIDRVEWRYIPDVTTMVANLLAGEIDVITVGAIKDEDEVTIRRAWDPTNGGQVIRSMTGLRTLYFGLRDPTAPWTRDVRVRRALVHGLDRQSIVDTLHYGLTSVADTLPPPEESVHKLAVERGLARYTYDPAQAERLMTEAGWTRPPGAAFQAPSGQRFSIELRTLGGSADNFRELLAIADLWSGVGFGTTTLLVPGDVGNGDEMRSRTEGVFSLPIQNRPEAMGDYISSQISTEAKSWKGRNRGGYSNPAYDQLFDQYLMTLDAARREGLLADLLKMASDEVPFVPVYYDVSVVRTAFRTGVRGPGLVSGTQTGNTWNIHTWEMTG